MEASAQVSEDKTKPRQQQGRQLKVLWSGEGDEAGGLLLPAEPQEEVGRGDSIFLGCESVKEQMSLVPVALGD